MAEPTPTTLDGFTPTWLTEELQRTHTISTDSTVTSVLSKILGEGEGFMGTVARLDLSYDGPPGPASMIAKIPTDVASNRATGRALGVYEREVRMYADVLPAIDVPQPEIYSAIYEADGHEVKLSAQTKKADRLPVWLLRLLIKRQQGQSDVPPCVLLMEDLSDVHVGDQVRGGSMKQMTAGLAVLARLHAQTWGVGNIPTAHWSDGAEHISRLLHALYLNSRRTFLDVASPFLSQKTIDLFMSLEDSGIDRVARHRAEVPQVLTHGDYRLDNMFFAADDSIAAVIDWQTTSPGPVVLDIGYFIVSSLPADNPESVVDDLLAGYHAELMANGVDDYPFDQFLDDYDDGLLILLHRLGGLTDVVDLGDGRGMELIETWLRRTEARYQRIL